jgi:uncharacterized protein Yka (UPF0111/DUF47 family)
VDLVKVQRWFLPETPDVLGMLRRQLEVTTEGVDALAQWAHGNLAKADLVRTLENRGDEVKRELETALTTAFSTPVEPEDLYALSRGADWILNYSKDLVRESEVMACPPDEALAEMCAILAESVHLLADAVAGIGTMPSHATDKANAALRVERGVEHVYRDAMGALVSVHDLREVMSRRELYRRVARIGEQVVEVAERVWYTVVKEG